MKKLFKVLRKAVRDRAAERPEIEPLADSVRIDGKTCLVTGANSGVGKAVAIDLARRGGHVLMACRSGHPDAGDYVKAASGSDQVEMLRVDLSDMLSVHRLCDALRDRETKIDIGVLNAGLMPRRARRTAQGGEGHVVVHSLCPGPVNTAIAREAPWFLKPLVVPMMRFFFLTPDKAARPVSYLCCAGNTGKRSGIYLHMLREKRPSGHATDPANGARLWQASQALLETHAPPS